MRFAIYSTMNGMPWGGSEELWSRAATELMSRGHQVFVNYPRRNGDSPQLARLRELGADVHWRRRGLLGRSLRRRLAQFKLAQLPNVAWLKQVRPNFLLISVGYHVDDVSVSQTCRRLGIPYGIVVQAASPYQWIDPNAIDVMRAAYGGAARCFFVSEQNRDILDTNLALDLSDAEIVDNPFNVRVDAAPTWPTSDHVWKLACVARIAFTSKSQDLLVDVLRRPKWRSRPLEIVLWGADGGNVRQVQALSERYGIQKQLTIGGFANDVEELWRNHHGLILPSRFEGNALAMIEAMMCGRIPIVTNVGRVAELVDDNRTGFIAPAATADLVDEALERAWQRRLDWQAMGAQAAQAIRQRHSQRPAEDFADALLATQQRSRLRIAA